MSTEVDTFDISSEVYDEIVADEVPLLVFRAIGCSVVTFLVGLTIIIYIFSGMLHVDCLAQVCCEACIFVAYNLILLTTTEPLRISENMCQTIAIFLHYCFVGASLFLLLEVVCMCQARVVYFQSTGHLTMRNVLLIGLLTPAVITGISAIIWFKVYTTRTNCWLNVNEAPYWTTMLPMVICACLQLIFILLTVIVPDAPITLPLSHYKRAKCYRTTRWASGIITLLLIMSWFFGVTAYHTRQENFYGAFTVSSILLGACIITLRISTDDEMREKINVHVLSILGTNNRVTAFENKASVPKDHKQAVLDSMRNGGLNGSVVSHK